MRQEQNQIYFVSREYANGVHVTTTFNIPSETGPGMHTSASLSGLPFPTDMSHLHINIKHAVVIEPGMIPKTKSLVYGTRNMATLIDGIIPDGVEALVLDGDFPIAPDAIPSSVTHLMLRGRREYYICKGMIPESVTYLYIDYYLQPDHIHIPNSVKTLRYRGFINKQAYVPPAVELLMGDEISPDITGSFMYNRVVRNGKYCRIFIEHPGKNTISNSIPYSYRMVNSVVRPIDEIDVVNFGDSQCLTYQLVPRYVLVASVVKTNASSSSNRDVITYHSDITISHILKYKAQMDMMAAELAKRHKNIVHNDYIIQLAKLSGFPFELLDRLQRKYVIAGGAIAYLLKQQVLNYKAEDIDVFVNDADDLFKLLEELETRYGYVVRTLRKSHYETSVYNVYLSPTPNYKPNLQFILQRFKTPMNVIERFDIDYIQCGYHNGQLYRTALCEQAHAANGIKQCWGQTKILRFQKYVKKGIIVSTLRNQTPYGFIDNYKDHRKEAKRRVDAVNNGCRKSLRIEPNDWRSTTPSYLQIPKFTCSAIAPVVVEHMGIYSTVFKDEKVSSVILALYCRFNYDSFVCKEFDIAIDIEEKCSLKHNNIYRMKPIKIGEYVMDKFSLSLFKNVDLSTTKLNLSLIDTESIFKRRIHVSGHLLFSMYNNNPSIILSVSRVYDVQPHPVNFSPTMTIDVQEYLDHIKASNQ